LRQALQSLGVLSAIAPLCRTSQYLKTQESLGLKVETGNIFTIAPDWTIEVLSPDQRPMKVLKNISHCIMHGSQMEWLIDPDERSILVLQPEQSLMVIDEVGAALPVPKFASAIQLTLGDVFGWLK
jgi:Uma2 family endonuclease